mmetsp:Transcript_36434/g.109430  ORF Transcript_36434/g.109430 Transcript_36434/m.109430 type:complete len:270 (-) Transcript_36434:194-1003(-)
MGHCCTKISLGLSDPCDVHASNCGALCNRDEREDEGAIPLPSVRYDSGIEYNLLYPPFVKDDSRIPGEFWGVYDVLINAPGGYRYRKHLTTDVSDSSLLVERKDDGRLKFQLVYPNGTDADFDYPGWTCFGDRVKHNDLVDAQCTQIGHSGDPLPQNYMGTRCGFVTFVDRRTASYRTSEQRTRDRNSPVDLSDAERDMAAYAAANENHWLHRKTSLPVDVVAEVRKFLQPYAAPPVFFFQKGDLWLETFGNDDSWSDVIYVARKRRTT